MALLVYCSLMSAMLDAMPLASVFREPRCLLTTPSNLTLSRVPPALEASSLKNSCDRLRSGGIGDFFTTHSLGLKASISVVGMIPEVLLRFKFGSLNLLFFSCLQIT